MSAWTLFGTETSPYVRRVRIVALELGEAFDLVNTRTDDGQARLREASPLWKVPVLARDDTTVFDSAAIVDHLIAIAGPGGPPLAPFDRDDVTARNLMTVIDGALDALINVFYLERDGVTDSDYVDKQRARAKSALEWLESRSEQLAEVPWGPLHIALLTTFEWMEFRETFPVDTLPALKAIVDQHRDRPSVQSTRPTS